MIAAHLSRVLVFRVLVFFVVNAAIASRVAAATWDLPAPTFVDGARLMLVEVRLNGRVFDEFQDLLYAGPQRQWLALAPIAEAAEADFIEHDDQSISVDFGTGTPTAQLDPAEKELTVEGERVGWPLGHVIRREGQVFLSSSLLYSLFGLDIELTDDQQSVGVNSARPLPADLRRMRERRWERYDKRGNETESGFTRLMTPYSLWGTPRGDLDVSSRGQDSPGGVRTSYSGALNVEAGFISNEVFFSGNDSGGLNRVRWVGGRESPTRDAFGVEGLSRLQVGDVSSLSVPLQGGAAIGRGVEFSTAPLNRAEQFDETRIAGDAIPGWDAELYRGGELIDFQRIQPDGRFRFEAVPLEFGNNDFRVVLYGPQGQVREERFPRSIAGGQVPPGEFQMRGSFVEPQRRTIPVESTNSADGHRLALRGDYGLTSQLTASLFTSVDDAEDPHREMTGFALRPSLGPVVSEFAMARQMDDGFAMQGNLSTTLAGVSFYTRYKHYSDDFKSPDRERFGSLIEDSVRFRISRGLGGFGSGSLQYERLVFESAEERETIEPRFRHRVGPLNVSHELRLNRQGSARQSHYRLIGSLRRRDITSRFQLRANGERVGDLGMTALSASVDWYAREDHRIGARLGHSYASHRTDVGLRYSWDFGPGRAGVSWDVDDDGGWAAGVNLTIGLGVEPNRGLRMMPPAETDSGAVSVRVFRDQNANGQYDEGEEDAQGDVAVLVDGRKHPARTDASGQVVVRSLSTRRPVQIELDPSSMRDPFLVPDQPRLEVQPRPGQTQSLAFDLRDSATLSGTLRHPGSGSGGIVIVAERQDAEGTQTTESFNDGYYAFDQLAPGRWVLRVSEDELPDGWGNDSVEVTLEEGEVSEGHDLSIEAQPGSDPND